MHGTLGLLNQTKTFAHFKGQGQKARNKGRGQWYG